MGLLIDGGNGRHVSPSEFRPDSSSNTRGSGNTSSPSFTDSVYSSENRGTNESSGTNSAKPQLVAQNNNNDNDRNDRVDGDQQGNSGAQTDTLTDIAVQGYIDDGEPDNQDRAFESCTTSGVNKLEAGLQAYHAARTAGETGEAAEIEFYEAANTLMLDTADELRQYALASDDPDSAIEEQSQVIRARRHPESSAADVALSAIDTATQQVLAETPEQRALEIKRTRVIRAENNLNSLTALNNGAENGGQFLQPEIDAAQAEYNAAVNAFQETVVSEFGVEIASAHLENARANAVPAGGSIYAYEISAAQIQQAEAQLEAAQQGQPPVSFTDAELDAALTLVKDRYQGMGLDPYLDSISGALQTNRDRVQAANNAPAELSVEVARIHMENARANVQDDPASARGSDAFAAFEAAQQQYEAAQQGEVPLDFTDAEMDQAVANLSARYEGFGLEGHFEQIAGQIIAYRDEQSAQADLQAMIDDARGQIDREMLRIAGSDDPVEGIPQELAESDPVTAAMMKVLGVRVDPDDPGLSIQERTIAEADPVAFALLQEAGIRFETNDVNVSTVTVNGEEIELTAEQRTMLDQNRVFDLTGSLLSNAEFSPETQATLVATMQARHEYTQNTVSDLIQAGDHSEALRVLDTNMSAAFSSNEANQLWTDIGEPVFTQEFFNERVQSLVAESGDDFMFAGIAGDWLESNFGGNMPPQAAGYLIDAIRGNMTAESVTGVHGSGVFYNAFSDLVEQAPDRAADAAIWYTEIPGEEGSFRTPMGGFGFSYTISEGHGATFSQAIVERAETLAETNDYMYGDAQGLRSEFKSVMQEAGQETVTKATRAIFDSFELNKNTILSNHFDRFASGPDVTQWISAQDTPELRNMVGRTLGLTPTETEAANEFSTSEDWFAEGTTQRVMVDLTVRAMIEEAGPGGQIRAIPGYVAGERAGAQNYALFETQNADGEITFIDGSALANAVFLNEDLIERRGEGVYLSNNIDGEIFTDWKYDDFEDFQKSNNSLPTDATLYVPQAYVNYLEALDKDDPAADDYTSFLRDIDGNGHIDYIGEEAAITTGGERFKMYADVIIGGVAIVGGIALAIPSGGTSLAITAGGIVAVGGGMAWGAYRTWEQYDHMSDHGQSLSWSNPNARSLHLSAGLQVAGAFALGSGGLVSAVRGTGTIATTVRNSAAVGGRVFGTTAAVGGVGMTAADGYNFIQNFDNMSAEERALGIANLGVNVADFGAGIWGNRVARNYGQLRADANAAVEAHNQGGTVPIELGNLDFSGGEVTFVSADGRTLRINPNKIQTPDLSADMPALWRDVQAQVPADGRTLDIDGSGQISFSSQDGTQSVIIRRAGAEDATPGPTQQTINTIDAEIRDSLGDLAPAEAASGNFIVVDDATFRTVHAQLSDTEIAVRSNSVALYTERTDGSPVVLVKEGAFNDTLNSLTRSQLAHELIRYYSHPDFRTAASSVDVVTLTGGGSNLLLGAAEYLAWRQTEQQSWSRTQEGGDGTYQDYLLEQLSHPEADHTDHDHGDHGGHDHDHGGVTWNPAEWAHSVEAMVAEQIFLEMGEPAFRRAVFEGDPAQLARFKELAEDYAAPDPLSDSQTVLSIFDRIRQIPKHILSGHDLFAVYRKEALSLAPMIEEWPAYFGIDKTYTTSAWARNVPEALRLAGPLADLIGDIHAHSRPYDRRSGDQPQKLIDRTGAFARILIGDIPQACGFAHYSNMNTSGLNVQNSRLLDDANTAHFETMMTNYRGWDAALGEVRRSDAQLARDIDVTVMTALRDNEGKITGSDLQTFETLLRGTDPQIANQLREAAAKNPHLAIRGDLSLTGFNPGGADSVDYLRQQLLKNPGLYRFLGEVTLQKEMVSVLLEGGATSFQHPASASLLTALNGYEMGLVELDAVETQLTDFQSLAGRSENLKGPVNSFRQAVQDGDPDAINIAARELRVALEAQITHEKNTIENFQKVLEFAQETGIGVLIHNDWGEARINENDGRPRETDDHQYEYFHQLMAVASQYPDANIVLAHTGLGRFVRPGQGTEVIVRPDGSQLTVPTHIARMYEAKELAPKVKFDISWNDVGEAFVEDTAMSEGLMSFIQDYPDTIIFGSDTVKPVNQAQYRQASTTLMPFFAELGRRDPQLLRKVLRDNYTAVLDNAESRVLDWTRQQLGDDDPEVVKADRNLELLHRGRALQDELADRHFDQVMTDLVRLEGVQFNTPNVDVWHLPPNQWHRPPAELYNIARLGQAAPFDRTGQVGAEAPTRFTPRGTPADQATVDAARRQLGIDVTRSAFLALGGAALSSTPLANLPSVARQLFFTARLQYKEFVRLSWEAMFEDGKISDANLRIFLDRVMTVGNAVGEDPQRLARVVDLTLQLRSDYSYLSRIDIDNPAGWTEQRKKEAVLALVGRYQSKVDRALGIQASSLDEMIPQVAPGRTVNDLIGASASLTTGSSVANFVTNLGTGNAAEIGFSGLAALTDVTALSTMAARAYVENYSGRTRTPETERAWAKWLNTWSLGALSAGGAVRSAGDVASFLSGDFISAPILAMLDVSTANLAAKSALNEHARVTGSVDGTVTAGPFEKTLRRIFGVQGVMKPEDLANVNQKLLAAIAASNIARTMLLMHALLQEEGEETVTIEMLDVPTTIARPLTETPGVPDNETDGIPTPDAPAVPGIIPPVTPPSAPRPSPVTVIPEIGLNLRSGPSIDDPKIGGFAHGADLQPTGRSATDDTGNRWIEVTGRTPAGEIATGWVAESYVRSKTAGPVEVVPDNGLNIRSGPSVDDEKLGTFGDGAVLEPTGREMTGDGGRHWIEVMGVLPTGDAVTGWVASEYVRPIPYDRDASLNGVDGDTTSLAMTYQQPMTAQEFLRMVGYS